MKRFAFAALLTLVAAPWTGAQERAVSSERLKKDVEWLASDERAGRRAKSDGWRASGEYVAEAFRAAGLEPGGDEGGWFQTVHDPIGPKEGRNVVGVVRAPGGTAKEHVVVMAHYDHLGVDPETGSVYNGADDNASGTAALVEIARTLDRATLVRDVVFVASDLEEQGLAGSRWYVANPALPIESTAAMICLDMLGRSVLDQMPGRVVALGAERSRAMREAIDRAAAATSDEVWHLGTEFVGPRSDFVPFAANEIPYVFFTTATHRDYHKTSDDAGDLDYDGLARHTALARALAIDLASRPQRPTWTGNEPDRLGEARAIAEMTGFILERSGTDGLSGKNRIARPQMWVVQGIHAHAKRLVQTGEVSDLDRAALIAGTYVLVLGVVDDTPYTTMKERIERFFGR